jgi:hypothetical protein
MEEMHRTHKEPVWGWVAVVADLVAKAHRARVRREARSLARTARSTPKALRLSASVVTPWSPRSPAGWSA